MGPREGFQRILEEYTRRQFQRMVDAEPKYHPGEFLGTQMFWETQRIPKKDTREKKTKGSQRRGLEADPKKDFRRI